MSAPTPAVRKAVYLRDSSCCASCGAVVGIQFQHRAADGMGGSGAPTVEEGLTSCWTCNPEYERGMQTLALARGWKVRRWVKDRDRVGDVPVFYVRDQMWFHLTTGGDRVAVSPAAAAEAMRDVYGDEYDRWLEGLKR